MPEDLIFDTQCDIESGQVQDDPLLIDFHLGNALNLDIVQYLVNGVKPDYDLYVPNFQRGAWEELSSIIPAGYKKKVGFLEITSRLFMEPIDRWETLTPNIWKRLADIVIRGLRKREIEVPITLKSGVIPNLAVSVPDTWIKMFNRILALISSLSEILRGGVEPPYASVWVRSNHVASCLLSSSNIVMVAGRNMSALIDHDSETSYIGNYDSVLLLMDTLGQRICAIVGTTISTPYQIGGCIPIANLLNIMRIGDQILYLNGNNGYEVIAMFEALTVSVILQQNPDNISDGREFYANCADEAIDLCQTLENPGATLILINEWIHAMSRLEAPLLSNLFCLYRVWGHPAVDIKKGMKKVFDKAMESKVSMNMSADLSLCQFRHMFLQSYISRHRQYPNMDVVGVGYVHECLLKGYPVDHKNAAYVLLDYMTVEINQIWTVPETYDVCHILHDKAVSPNRRELLESINAGRGTVFGTLRRGIIRWMEGDSIRCKEFLDHIDQNGLSEDDMIIGMYEKEREIKVKARMFSLMSEKMRMYIVLTEELIANHILPYFPEITMKDPLNVQIRKIWKVGGAGQYENNPNINIDFEKWNLNMRSQFTDGLFGQMDRMFGYKNLVLRTHDIFKNSLIYSCSGKYRPPTSTEGFIPDPPMAYIGHQGGFEGLRQKGWTVATVCLLAYTAWQLKIDMQLLGQGDNQVIKLYMPLKRWENLCYTEEAKIAEARSITSGYLQKMRVNFDDAGLPVKVRETWVSTRLFMYGKAMYLDGISLPQWMKKLLRSYALSNEGSVTISGVIGTIATNMTSAAGVSDAPDVMYLIYLFLGEWSLEYLIQYHPFTRKRILQGAVKDFMIPGRRGMVRTNPISIHRLVTSLLLIPTAVGGSVTIPLTGFIVRGFPDHASEGYAWLNLLRSVDSIYRGLFDNWYSFMKNGTVQCDMLVQSPWSLNHLKPPTPGLQSRDMVREWLLSGRFSRNKFLTNMSSIDKSFNRKEICRELMSDPINPLITYEIFQSLPQSYYDQILRRFEGTRSVLRLAMRESYTEPIIKRLMEMEERHLDYVCWRAETPGEVLSPCATEQARLARNLGWEREIKGLTTPHPLEFAFSKMCHGFNPTCDESDYILVRCDPDGEYPPYLGSRVKTKVVSLQDESARAEPLICSNARLARYLKWLNLGENMINVVKTSTESLCDTNVFDNFYDLTPGAEGYTGCSEHRFNPAAASDGCFINYSPQLGAKVYMSGDYMPVFGKGKENYTIHFQALYCFLQYVSTRAVESTTRHHHLHCSTCIVPCDDEISDISVEHPYLDRAFSEENTRVLRDTIGFIHEKPKIRLIQTEYLAVHNEIPFNSDTLSATGCYYGMVYTLAVKSSLAILTKGGDGDMLGTEDLQSFPRVYSYKIYVDHVMEAMCNILLYMFLMRGKEPNNLLGITRAKRGLLRFLNMTPLVRFKDLASLCVGRNSKSRKTRFRIPTGRFPDDTMTFIRGVKSCLVDTITETSGFNNCYPKRMFIGKMSVTEREYKIMLGMNGIIRYQCLTCGELLWKDVDLSEDRCRSGHLNFIMDQIVLTPASLDRMSKMLTVKHKIKTICGTPLPLLETRAMHRSQWYASEETQENRDFKQCRRINLPTASVYKWTAVLSSVPKDYDIVIILGDGTGGTSMVSSVHFNTATIFPLAKFEKHKMIPQDSESIHPFLSRGYRNVKYELLESVPDDIFSDLWVKELRHALYKIAGDILILSDIEGVETSRLLARMGEAFQDAPADIIVKVYMHEVIEDHLDWLPIVIETQHANVGYNEAFLTNISKRRLVVNKGVGVKAGQVDVERLFSDAVGLSWSLARHKLISLGMSLGRGTLLGDPGIMLIVVLGYINAQYRFPQDKIRSYDRRNLTDGILIKIVRALKILILSFLEETSADCEWFKCLTLARATKKDRNHAIMTRKINIVQWGYEMIPMITDDIIVARTLRGFRARTFRAGSLSSIFELIQSREGLCQSQDIRDLITDSDSVDDASDISYEN
ncbi:TPA_asm: polyprotein [Aconitum virus 1]|uniref:RNA-directed RNA polymerase n=1 Tax=Aconitum virus 1 TaxID=2977949 RepID=A0A9N6YJ92_9RHAB|nr:TPA_asm: polyprotein [Aconitum virus 1]